MGWWIGTLWVRTKVGWRYWSRCLAMAVDPEPNERGTFNAWFCRLRPWHLGDHHDPHYDARWSR